MRHAETDTDFEKIFEMFSHVEKGETCRFRLPNPEGFASSLEISAALANLAETAKKILKSLEKIHIIKFAK